MRVVLDVNVLTRAALGSELAAKSLRRVFESGGAVLVSDLMLAELAETIAEPRLAGRVNPALYENLVAELKQAAEEVEITPPFPFCRDPDDAYLLAMARDGRADFLVTNDADLLVLQQLDACELITLEDFLRRWNARTPA